MPTFKKKEESIWVPVSDACNPSYSGGRDQEDHGLKPALGKNFVRSNLENTKHKKVLAGWLKW
jgi:hypothetical protein